MTMANFNPATGIAYGYISANVLDSDVVTSLTCGDGVREFVDHTWEMVCQEGIREYRMENPDESDDMDDAEILDLIRDDLADYPEECNVSGVYQGVHFQSSWLGGALNFFIMESPVVTDKARMASPCVPNAGILDTLDGSVTSYDVPADWRKESVDSE
jgi:hypothetical protein